MRTSRALWMCAVAQFALLSTASTGHAAAAEAAQQPAGEASITTLPDVVVTARRRSENAQSVPITISAFSTEKLAEKSITSLEQLTLSTPGLTYGRAGGSSNPQIVIRGQSRANLGDPAQPVLTYFQDVPLPTYGSVLPTYDLASVQVLKGPQGTLFGRNSTSGAVLVYPTAPTFEFGGYVQGGVGNLNRREIEGAVNIPILADKVGLRLSAQRVKRDPFTKNLSGKGDFDDINTTSYRVSLLAQPIDGLRNITVYDYFKTRGAGDGVVFHEAYPGAIPQRTVLRPFFGCGTSITCDIDLAAAAQAQRDKRTTTADFPARIRNDVAGFANTTTWDVGDLTFKNILGYRTVKTDTGGDIDGTNLPMIVAINYIQFKQWSEEFQIQGSFLDGKLQTIAGAFYLKFEPNGDSGFILASFSPPARPSVIQSYRTQTSKAVFAAGSYDLSSIVQGLKINLGARHTADETEACSSGYPATFPTAYGSPLASEDGCRNGQTLVINGISTPVKGSVSSEKSDALTWNAGLDWQATPDIFLYVTARKGYRAGGVNTPLFSTTAPRSLSSLQGYGPETVTDYEVGLKSQWRSGDWSGRFNIDFFRGEYKNTQRGVNGLGGFDGDGNLNNDPSAGTIIINAGEARVQGVDIDAMVSPFPSLNFSVFASFNDQEYLSLNTPALLATTTAFPVNPGDTAFPYAPETTYGANVRYESKALGELGSLVFNLDYYHASRTYYSPFKTDKSLSQAPYGVFNGRVDLVNVAGSKAVVSAYVKNITDEVYVVGGANTAPAAGFNSFYYNEPRTYGLLVNYKF